ncbi:NAD(P)-binding protein [Pleurostoma richardsiae]|uniref:NAD(P)-binding protein n=1 Tax=Pleurostoma richardsiae TaxID=41990 RepID=A0AA38S2Y3_9PEZI|nr:NAD(P)-binding protein [Pleurostoma richardsiae]
MRTTTVELSTSKELASLSFDGRTAIVTGTTNGLGQSISEELVKRHIGTLIMGVRNIKRGEEVKAELLAKPELRATKSRVTIHVVELQMDDFRSVIAFADKVKDLTTTVDILLLNAGLGGFEFQTAKTGHERIMQVNVYSNALLALELLPLLQQTATIKARRSRLTWVGSFVQMDHTLTKNPISTSQSIIGQFDERSRFNRGRYQDSKLMSTMVVKQLAQHVDKNLVIFNEVSPGPVLTNFASAYPAYFRVGIAFIGLFINKSKSLAGGVNKYLHAMAIAGEESHGEYISDYKIAPRAPIIETSTGKELEEKFFAEVMEEFTSTDKLPEQYPRGDIISHKPPSPYISLQKTGMVSNGTSADAGEGISPKDK